MQKCITSHWFAVQAKLTKIIGFVFMAVFCLLGIIVLVSNSSNRSEAVAVCLLFVMLGIAACVSCIVIYIIDTRTYNISSDGITIQYADFYIKHYPWSDVSNIAICDVYHSTRVAEIYETVIRFSIGEEPDGPLGSNTQLTLSGHKKWSTYEYGLAHCQTVISISYTSDRLEQVKRLSGKEVVHTAS